MTQTELEQAQSTISTRLREARIHPGTTRQAGRDQSGGYPEN